MGAASGLHAGRTPRRANALRLGVQPGCRACCLAKPPRTGRGSACPEPRTISPAQAVLVKRAQPVGVGSHNLAGMLATGSAVAVRRGCCWANPPACCRPGQPLGSARAAAGHKPVGALVASRRVGSTGALPRQSTGGFSGSRPAVSRAAVSLRPGGPAGAMSCGPLFPWCSCLCRTGPSPCRSAAGRGHLRCAGPLCAGASPGCRSRCPSPSP
jgi:hypothetical protein